MTFKDFWTKIKDVSISFFTYLGLIFSGAVALFLLFRNLNKNNTVDTVNIEDIQDEIKNTTSSDIIADSPNQSDISASIEQQQTEFRERIRDRFNKNIHR